MRRTLSGWAAVPVLVLGALVGTIAPSSGQELRRFNAPVATCATVVPNATLTLGSPAALLRSASPSTAYGTQGCDRYVVDFRVGPTSLPECGAQVLLDLDGAEARPAPPGGIDFDTDEATCSSWRVETTVYLRASGQLAFRPVRAFTRTGRWQQAGARWGCSWNSLVESIEPRSHELGYRYWAPSSGTDTYRVAVRSTANGAKRLVEAVLTPSCQVLGPVLGAGGDSSNVN